MATFNMFVHVDIFMTLTPSLIEKGVNIEAVLHALQPLYPVLLREGRSNCTDHRLIYHIRLHDTTFPPTIKVKKTTCKLFLLRRQYWHFKAPCGTWYFS